MAADINRLKKLSRLLSLHLHKKQIIVLEPESDNYNEEIDDPDDRIVYDANPWNVPDDLREWTDELSSNEQLSIEEKIMLLYNKMCIEYVYDDNLISYINKIDDDLYELPDWYGRDTEPEWEQNRSDHNRRVCFELSRYFAKSLMQLLNDDGKYNVCIFWDKNLIHYFVGLTCDDYSIAFDLDDFMNIKDLTRLKTDLTAKGITVLEDREGDFRSTLDRFNKYRNEYSIEKMELEIEDEDNARIISSPEEPEDEDATFLRNCLDVLIKKYGIDSQGIFEFMKEIADMRLLPGSRKKVWKKIDGQEPGEYRYIRCLLADIDGQEYLIDGDEGIMRKFDEAEYDVDDPTFIRFKELSHDDDERYSGK